MCQLSPACSRSCCGHCNAHQGCGGPGRGPVWRGQDGRRGVAVQQCLEHARRQVHSNSPLRHLFEVGRKGGSAKGCITLAADTQLPCALLRSCFSNIKLHLPSNMLLSSLLGGRLAHEVVKMDHLWRAGQAGQEHAEVRLHGRGQPLDEVDRSVGRQSAEVRLVRRLDDDKPRQGGDRIAGRRADPASPYKTAVAFFLRVGQSVQRPVFQLSPFSRRTCPTAVPVGMHCQWPEKWTLKQCLLQRAHRSMVDTNSRASALAVSASFVGAALDVLHDSPAPPLPGVPTASSAGVTRRSTSEAVSSEAPCLGAISVSSAA